MDCLSDTIFNRYHDCELSATDAEAVRSHLAACPACAARLAEMASMSDLIRSAPLPLMAREAMNRLHARMLTMQDQSVRRLASWMTLAASVVLGVSLYIATNSQAQATSAPISNWEAAAIGVDVSQTADDVTPASWIVADLIPAVAPDRSQP
jgi:anti-sigma factor RsiW